VLPTGSAPSASRRWRTGWRAGTRSWNPGGIVASSVGLAGGLPGHGEPAGPRLPEELDFEEAGLAVMAIEHRRDPAHAIAFSIRAGPGRFKPNGHPVAVPPGFQQSDAAATCLLARDCPMYSHPALQGRPDPINSPQIRHRKKTSIRKATIREDRRLATG
jgi:hypothetical protein